MQLSFDQALIKGYKSPSQKAKRLTEGWVLENVFCPQCGKDGLTAYPPSHKSADFFCSQCNVDYELKSKKGHFGRKLTGAKYEETRKCFQSDNVPHFFFLQYSEDGTRVVDFYAIPKFYFVSRLLVKRNELTADTERSGWIGCYILLHKIPDSARVHYIQDGRIRDRAHVLRDWENAIAQCEERRVLEPGWAKDVLNCILKLKRSDFSLEDAYGFEAELLKKYPKNHHIRPKIRQQLQVLRDKRYLGFSSKKGTYRLT